MDYGWLATEAESPPAATAQPEHVGNILAGAGGEEFGVVDYSEIVKALRSKSGDPKGPRPQKIKDNVSLAARRYLSTFTGVHTNHAPHLDYNVLRRLTERNPVIQAIHNTLINQVSSYFQRPLHPRAIGVKVMQKGKKKPVSPAAGRMIEYIEDVLFKGGVPSEHKKTGQLAVWDGHYKRRAAKLGDAIRFLIRDSLTLDQVFISIEGSKPVGGKVKHPVMYWSAEDAALARYTEREEYQPRVRIDGPSAVSKGEVEYVLLDPMCSAFQVMKEFTWKDGAIGHRNGRTEFATFGYGQAEAEQCLDCVIGVLYGMSANREYFTENHVPLGMLNLVGNYGERELKGLRAKFRNEIGLPGHFWEFPIISTPPGQGAGAQWVPMQARDRMDMIFRAYIEFCVAVGAAVYQISPEEFGFGGFGGPQNSLQEADPSSTLQHSQHKGLVPKVLWLAEFLTEHIVQRIDPDFELRVQGLEAVWTVQEQQALARDQMYYQLGYTPNMVQAMNDEPPLVDPKNGALWRDVEDYFESLDHWFPSARDRVRSMVKVYEELGGELGCLFDAPIGLPHALEVWMMEHQGELMMQQEVQPQLMLGEAEGARQQQQLQMQGQQALEQGQAQAQTQKDLESAKAEAAMQQMQAGHGLEIEKLGMTGQQQQQQLEMKGGMDKELATMGHQHTLEAQGQDQVSQLIQMLMGQGHDVNQGEAQRGHEKEMAGEQRMHDMLNLGLQHQQKVELGDRQHDQSLDAAEHQHILGLEAGGVQHHQGMEADGKKHQQAQELAQLDHFLQQQIQSIEQGHEIDMAELQSVLGMVASHLGAEQGHGHALEQQEHSQAGQADLADQGHAHKQDDAVLQAILGAFASVQGSGLKQEEAEQGHGHRKAEATQKHQHARAQADQGHGHALEQQAAGAAQKGELEEEKDKRKQSSDEALMAQEALGGLPMVEDAGDGLSGKKKPNKRDE